MGGFRRPPWHCMGGFRRPPWHCMGQDSGDHPGTAWAGSVAPLRQLRTWTCGPCPASGTETSWPSASTSVGQPQVRPLSAGLYWPRCTRPSLLAFAGGTRRWVWPKGWRLVALFSLQIWAYAAAPRVWVAPVALAQRDGRKGAPRVLPWNRGDAAPAQAERGGGRGVPLPRPGHRDLLPPPLLVARVHQLSAHHLRTHPLLPSLPKPACTSLSRCPAVSVAQLGAARRSTLNPYPLPCWCHACLWTGR